MIQLVKVAKIKEGDIKHKYVCGGMGGGGNHSCDNVAISDFLNVDISGRLFLLLGPIIIRNITTCHPCYAVKIYKNKPQNIHTGRGGCPVPRSWICLWLQRLTCLPHPGNTCFLIHLDRTSLPHWGERIHVAGGSFSQTTHPEQWKTQFIHIRFIHPPPPSPLL